MRRFISTLIMFLAVFSSGAYAGEFSKIAGKYIYEKYTVTHRNGKVQSFNNIGAKSATLEITEGGYVNLVLTMSDGKTVNQTAKIEQLEVVDKKEYLTEKWSNMSYSVKKQFRLRENTLEYYVKYTDRSDVTRYGSLEYGLLRRIR